MADQTSVDAGLPSLAPSIDGLSPLCDECQHPAIIKPRRPSALRKLLRLPPRPAECPVHIEDVSGLGTLPCGCQNSAHGS